MEWQALEEVETGDVKFVGADFPKEEGAPRCRHGNALVFYFLIHFYHGSFFVLAALRALL
jgi:hypothetical protein